MTERTLREKIEDVRAKKLSPCCGKRMWLTRVGNWVCPVCKKIAIPKIKKKLEYNCTLSYFAEQINIKLWQAMCMMKYAERRQSET